ncbi:conjugal transfer protein TraC [Candidatus Kaiserbacteria bacterium]|nr:conjugal transfer protein TraC [Candidatus Kaiserbacteria bacterium]
MVDNTLRASAASTQEFVPVSEVRDGIIVLKDGSLRAILLASSINFALKSEDEQTAFIVQFQNFLNSLDFSCQIFVQSRMLDIRPYVGTLEAAYKEQLDDLMRVQIREYIEFIKSFTEAASIMTKNFFVVVPYEQVSLSIQTTSSLMPFKKKQVDQAAANRTFEEQVSQLEQRVSIVQQGLTRTGVRTVQLGTEEAIELLYKMFNPGEDGKPIPVGQPE